MSDKPVFFHEESQSDRLARKTKEAPFFPIAIGACAIACALGAYGFKRKGKMSTSVYLMQLRVAAQGLAVGGTSNPFAALLEEPKYLKTTNTIEGIFGFTLDPNKKNLVFLEDLSESLSTNTLTKENLEHALFERILLRQPQDYIKNVNDEICEAKIIVYLFNCLEKTNELQDDDLRPHIEDLILRNVITALKQPELHEGQDVYDQLYSVLKTNSIMNQCLIQIYKRFCDDADTQEDVNQPFKIVLTKLHKDIAKATPTKFPMHALHILNIYVSHEELGKILLDYCQPKHVDVGAEYANTLFGAWLSISALPKVSNGTYEFFQDPLDQASVVNTREMLWIDANKITQDLHLVILNLLKCTKETRSGMLKWLGNCLKANTDRGKLWNTHLPDTMNPSNFNTVSDGFMLNYVTVLLRFCQPFCTHTSVNKILKVDPTYCAVSNDECLAKEIHLLNMSKETCLIPYEEDQVRPTSSSYNFVTECFFMAHRAFDLGFRVINEKLVRLNQEMSRIERAYQEAVTQAGAMSEIADSIKQRMSSELSKYLSIKCSMSEPSFQDLLFNFITASAYWLNQVAINVDHKLSNAPLESREINFPLPSKAPDTLMCIPEFVVENIVCYLIFIRRFNPNMFEEHGYERLNPVLSCILVYMSSSNYTKNPHLRAHLAEALEALLPFHKDEPSGLSLGGVQRERLFKEHKHRGKIVEILLDVFVGIEMTGQNVQFEQKFNYRRPMYMVMDYLWESEDFQQCFLSLAKDAECNMEAVSPPIFLRFVNLLINDAIFLLDESLANMSKLREIQTARDSGEWNHLPAQERAQNMGYLQHIGMLARFDNILGRDTIRTLDNLTSKITIVFTHSTMVDRVASMLNYFLFNLVGPNQKNFKVKDFKEYHFDPAATVLDICKIYVNLKESDSFCLAVSQDGRSYSPQLFTLAEDVLVRIGGGTLIGELQEVAKKVAQKATEYETNEAAVADAPEHFLDPIMSSLMLDPVILPSSKQTVDRSTIARHLLSDQTDPFNRAPLSMDQVIPNTQLAEEIKIWMDERKMKR
ncbi:hypothetical protein RN001_014486 [Aquatica leii]|uniref:Ubiquitin conjugation factor E4 A n=1 Tax=Aquatica leii TaxID=1421715 RepID=A0AAN7NXX6_9COLE|nr:hypothetical protein RN001_014486 [Aquatica leii]